MSKSISSKRSHVPNVGEEYLEDKKDISKSGLSDYKFYCFHGKPQFLYLSQGLEDHKTSLFKAIA